MSVCVFPFKKKIWKKKEKEKEKEKEKLYQLLFRRVHPMMFATLSAPLFPFSFFFVQNKFIATLKYKSQLPPLEQRLNFTYIFAVYFGDVPVFSGDTC